MPSRVPKVSNTLRTLSEGCHRPTIPILGRDRVSCQINTDSCTPASMLLNTLDLGLYYTIIISVSLAVMTTLSNQLLGATLLAEAGDIQTADAARMSRWVPRFAYI